MTFTAEEKAALKVQLQRWRKDPVLFVRKGLNAEPSRQQARILRAFAKSGAKVAVKAGHGVGKSAIMAWVAMWVILLFKNSKAAATAPSATQLKDVLMAEIAKWVNQAHPWVRDQFEASSMRLSIRGAENTQFLTARTARADKPDALQGLHANVLAFLIDEAFGVADNIFEVAKGALSTPGARMLICGNPTATSGYAFNAFHINSHLFECFTLSCLDSPLVSENYIKEMKAEYGEESDVYKVRVLGEFPSAAINQLIPRELADAASKRTHGIDSYYYAPKILGVDVAWEGDDRSAVWMRQGLVSRKLGTWYKIDNMSLGGLVNQWWDEHKIDAVFIDVGWGTGVIDYLRSLGRAPIPVNFGGGSSIAEYHNKRTEMWGELRKWLHDGGEIEPIQDLIEDLIGPTYSFLPNGKKLLEKKKDMKRRGLKSPDLADALALTFAAPIIKQTEIEKVKASSPGGSPAKYITDYDIFA